LDTHSRQFGQHRKALNRLFGEMEDSFLRSLLEKGTEIVVKTGEFLVHQNDVDNTFYIVLSGRFRAFDVKEDGLHILGEIAAGEPIGEFALFTSEPRNASVIAIRKSVVLKLTEADYYSILQSNPTFAGELTKFIIQRFRRNKLEQHIVPKPKNIAVIKLQADHDLSPWTDEMRLYYESNDIPINVYTHDSFDGHSEDSLFEEMEANDGLNLLICSEEDLNWSKQSLIFADVVVVATEFYADSELYEIEKYLDFYNQNIQNKKTFLLLLHPEDADQPLNTRRWFEHRNIEHHIHVRKNNVGDTRRFCRILINRGVGVVLGGGGAKGYAHVGAVRLLLEQGVEFDFVGGTSAGAIYGSGMALTNFDMDRVEQLCKRSVDMGITSGDYTLPLMSMMSGKKMAAFLDSFLHEYRIEDFWVTYYCISTNYSTAQPKHHKYGLAKQSVQASIAIPGVFPPVVVDGDLHVDGAVMDNLPIEPMYSYPVSNIVAIALTSLHSYELSYKHTPTSWTLMWDKITGRRKYRVPSLGSIIINSLTLNSRLKQEQSKSSVSIYMELNLKGYSIMNQKKWRDIMQAGYEQMEARVKELEDGEKFWLEV